MSALTLQDLQYALARGGTVHRVEANGTVNVHVGPCRLLQAYCAAPGTGWTVTIYDDDDGTDDEVHQFVTADGKGRELIDVRLSTALRVVAAGVAAGTLLLSYIPLEV